MQYRVLQQLLLPLLVLQSSNSQITVNVTAVPSDVAVIEYGGNTDRITCLYNVMPELAKVPEMSIVTFANVPETVTLILRNHQLDALIIVRDVRFENSLSYTFALSNVRQSARLSCDIFSPELSRLARRFVKIYVRTDDDGVGCDSGKDLNGNRECIDNQSVCKLGHHLRHDRKTCVPAVSPRQCLSVNVCKQCSCRRTAKHVVELPYKTLTYDESRDLANVVAVDGQLFGVAEKWETCHECANNVQTSRFMTALIVTFLVLLSGAVTVIGTAVLYDWCKRRRDLQELEREHTEVNPDAVEVEALRRVVEDRPPSYVESRKSDLHLAGVPPPSYEEICHGNRTPTQNVVSVSTLRLSAACGSVPCLEPIHERRLSV